MKAVVTGAGGFVGANLVDRLAGDGHDVVALTRSAGKAWRLADTPAQVVEIDLAAPGAIGALIRDARPDWVFHLAAHGAYSWQQDLAQMAQVNLLCTAELLDAAREVGARVVSAGSSSEYGFKDHPAREDEWLEPNSEYSLTKAAGTHLCRLAAARHGQRAVTLRLYSIYGPWEEPGRLLPTLVRRCLDGGWPPLVGPDTARDFVWVHDACDAFVRAAAAEDGAFEPGAVFNIGSGVQTTLAQLVDEASVVFGVSEAPAWGSMAQRSWDTSVWVSDPSAAAGQLGWRATTPLAEGLRGLGDWMSARHERLTRYA